MRRGRNTDATYPSISVGVKTLEIIIVQYTCLIDTYDHVRSPMILAGNTLYQFRPLSDTHHFLDPKTLEWQCPSNQQLEDQVVS